MADIGRAFIEWRDTEQRRHAGDNALDNGRGRPATGSIALAFIDTLRLIEHSEDDKARVGDWIDAHER